MFNILVGCICLWVAYDAAGSNSRNIFVPLNLLLGIANIGIGIMSAIR